MLSKFLSGRFLGDRRLLYQFIFGNWPSVTNLPPASPSPSAQRRRSVSKESSVVSQCASPPPPPGFLRSGSTQGLYPRCASSSGSTRSGDLERSKAGFARGNSPHYGLVQQQQQQCSLQLPLLLTLQQDQAGNRKKR